MQMISINTLLKMMKQGLTLGLIKDELGGKMMT